MSDNRIDDGGPAFPETRWDDKTHQEVQWLGMTLRDYFAAKAGEKDIDSHLTGPIVERVSYGVNGERHIQSGPLHRTREEAKFAYADAMLKARQS